MKKGSNLECYFEGFKEGTKQGFYDLLNNSQSGQSFGEYPESYQEGFNDGYSFSQGLDIVKKDKTKDCCLCNSGKKHKECHIIKDAQPTKEDIEEINKHLSQVDNDPGIVFLSGIGHYNPIENQIENNNVKLLINQNFHPIHNNNEIRYQFIYEELSLENKNKVKDAYNKLGKPVSETCCGDPSRCSNKSRNCYYLYEYTGKKLKIWQEMFDLLKDKSDIGMIEFFKLITKLEELDNGLQ